MSMFNWQAFTEQTNASPTNDTTTATPSPAPPVVSHLFYIYWAVAAPLTVIVMVGWWAWWRMESRRYENDVLRAVSNVNRLLPQPEKRGKVGLPAMVSNFGVAFQHVAQRSRRSKKING
jgi:hypothetical protein